MKIEIELDGTTISIDPAGEFFQAPVETLTESLEYAANKSGVLLLARPDGPGSFGLPAPVAFADDGARKIIVCAPPYNHELYCEAGYGGPSGGNMATFGGKNSYLALVASGGVWHVVKSEGVTFWQSE